MDNKKLPGLGGGQLIRLSEEDLKKIIDANFDLDEIFYLKQSKTTDDAKIFFMFGVIQEYIISKDTNYDFEFDETIKELYLMRDSLFPYSVSRVLRDSILGPQLDEDYAKLIMYNRANLSEEEIALICYYNGDLVTNENKTEIANKFYKDTKGKKIYEFYNLYRKDEGRINYFDSKRKAGEMIKRMNSARTYFEKHNSSDSKIIIEKVNKDIEAVEKYIDKHFP